MRKQSSINNFLKRGGTIDQPEPKKVGERQNFYNKQENDDNPAVSKKSFKQIPPNFQKMMPRNLSHSKPREEDEERKSSIDLSKKYKLSISQKKVLDAIMSRRSVFFTGAAGTGKSYVVQILRTVIEALGWENKIAYTAPTGVAACNIRGLTIHAWAGVGKASEPIEQLLPIVLRNSNACKRWRETDILVIDEISMLSSELFDKLDVIGRRVRNNINPFGGLQVIVCGDFFQLPPVGLGKSVKFCFESVAWKELFEENRDDGMIMLDKVFRQQDDTTFLNLLNEMREGSISSANQQILLQKVQDAQRQLQQQLSSASTGNFSSASFLKQSATKQSKLVVRPTKLFSTNNDVDQYNMTELERLTMLDDENDEKDPKIYFAVDQGKEPYLTQLKAGTKAPATLHLKKGAQVMLLKNLDTESGLVNGARGTVVDFERSGGRTSFCTMLPVVNFSVIVGTERREERVLLAPETWEIKLGESILASRQQIPLMLAWAISIHKSQGMTIPFLEVSFNRMFEYGQAYVALSRATSLQGLTLQSFQAHSIRAHPLVKDFYRQIAHRQQTQRQGRTDDVLEVSLKSFVDAFMTEFDGKQVDHESWMETKPRGPANTSYKSFLPQFSSSTAPCASRETIPANDENVNDQADCTFSSSASTFRSASSINMRNNDLSPTSSSELNNQHGNDTVIPKKPSVLFNASLSSSKRDSCQNDNAPQFQDVRSSNAFGDDWLDADFLAKKRLESNQRIMAMAQQYQEQLSTPSLSSLVDATSSKTGTIASTVDNTVFSFPVMDQNSNSAPSSSTKNNASSPTLSSATSSAEKKVANVSSCDVVDLVDSSDDNKEEINEKSSWNPQNVKTELSRQQLQQQFYQSTLREQQSQFNHSTDDSANYGGYGISPHLAENGQSLERILSTSSSKSTSLSQSLSHPNPELPSSPTTVLHNSMSSSSVNTKSGQIVMTDTLKRKLDENRQKALEKLAMFKKSRLHEPSLNSI